MDIDYYASIASVKGVIAFSILWTLLPREGDDELSDATIFS